jgi:hypothetical protein
MLAFAFLALMTSCQTTQNTQDATADAAKADQDEEVIDYAVLDPDGDGMTDEGLPLPIRPEDRDPTIPTVVIPLVHQETGEVREVEARVVQVDKKEYFLPDPDPSMHLDLNGRTLVNADGEKVTLSSDQVTIIEYWSVDSIESNMYWNRMRYLEREHPVENLQILSVNYDMVQSGKGQIAQALKKLENYTPPANLLFDLKDGMRDYLPRIPGPASYFLIDGRKQITASGRGDRQDIDHLLKRLEDALIHQDGMRNKGKITVVKKED